MDTQLPVGASSSPEFTQKALDKNFQLTLTRKQCIVLANALAPISFPVGDMRGKVLREILETVQKDAIESIRPSDYVQTTTPLEPTPPVTTS